MALLAPPPSPPRVAIADDGHLYRLHFRLWQIFISFFATLLTAWICTFGAVAAILAIMVAKHVLVAVLMMGHDLPPLPETGQGSSEG
jgi:hypothetical protein